jgi:hypothetical protein
MLPRALLQAVASCVPLERPRSDNSADSSHDARV